MIPEWAKNLKIGDQVAIKENQLTRSEQIGTIKDIFDDGVILDFFCDVFGDPEGLPSIEFWEWDEISEDGII